jgi:hypothetical protein
VDLADETAEKKTKHTQIRKKKIRSRNKELMEKKKLEQQITKKNQSEK